MPKQNHERSLGDALKAWIDQQPYADEFRLRQLLDQWPSIAGPQIAEQTEKVWMSKGILHIQVASPIWRQQLFYERENIRARLNELAGKELVQEVKLL